MTRILTIEDDPTTAREIMTELEAHGFEVDWASTGRDGLARVTTGSYNLLTVDRMLPDMDGLAVVGAIRGMRVETRILMISALSDVDERVRGLRAGGDDYLTKPFAPEEMAARVEVLLRRHQEGGHEPHQLQSADLHLDLVTRSARRGSREIKLLPTEFKILELLMRNAGRIITRTMIFESVWNYRLDPGTNLIDVHIGRLRKKIDLPGLAPLIHTVRGSGYMLNANR
ncbi:MAG TPA: response regulator transcription factor [Gammaproteobacteria bacterium]|jgi:two-component system OmpR family response regulator